MDALHLDWSLVWSHLFLLGIAYLLALPAAWNRERYSRSAGLRTYPLVAISTCAFMLVAIDVFTTTDAEARVLQGIITGMGFIGGGAIVKTQGNVSGTATAASLWSVGAIGLAVAWQRFEIAIVLSVIIFFTLQLLPEVKHMVVVSDEPFDDRQND